MSETEIVCPCGLPRPHPGDGSRCWHPRYLADATDPRFTDGQRAHLARFEAAEVPTEVVEAGDVERVARAIVAHRVNGGTPQGSLCRCGEITRDHDLHLAAAAIAAMPR